MHTMQNTQAKKAGSARLLHLYRVCIGTAILCKNLKVRVRWNLKRSMRGIISSHIETMTTYNTILSAGHKAKRVYLLLMPVCAA